MADEETPKKTFEDAPVDDRHDKINQVDLQLEMQRSYLDYAMSVSRGACVTRWP